MQAGTLQELMTAGCQAVDVLDQKAARFEDRFFASVRDILSRRPARASGSLAAGQWIAPGWWASVRTCQRIMKFGDAASTEEDADVAAGPNRELAAFVRQFLVATAEHLPAHVVAELEERVLTKAYEVLHRDPISMIPAMSAFANDASVDLASHEELLARLPALRERHARLNRELRAIEGNRRLSAMRAGPDMVAERNEFMWRIVTLLEERQAVNSALRDMFSQRVPAEIRDEVELPPRTDRDVERWINRGYRARGLERPAPEPADG